MAQEYLPAPSNVRLADLMKEHNISQPELAKEIGCSKSTISRFISGAKGTLTHEQVLKIARLFNVSTDFLLGETNIPDRKNYDIAELGLSVEAAKNLYTGRVNTEVVNLLLENARFAELTYRIAQYFARPSRYIWASPCRRRSTSPPPPSGSSPMPWTGCRSWMSYRYFDTRQGVQK